ncbi:hypothetical protein AKJ16_DCAP18190 [Drosera capensis]
MTWFMHGVWTFSLGDPTEKIGIVDSEYVVHYGLPTLGGSRENETNIEDHTGAAPKTVSMNLIRRGESAHESKERDAVRKQAYTDLERFKYRWRKAVAEDKSWTDRYRHTPDEDKSRVSSHGSTAGKVKQTT